MTEMGACEGCGTDLGHNWHIYEGKNLCDPCFVCRAYQPLPDARRRSMSDQQERRTSSRDDEPWFVCPEHENFGPVRLREMLEHEEREHDRLAVGREQPLPDRGPRR